MGAGVVYKTPTKFTVAKLLFLVSLFFHLGLVQSSVIALAVACPWYADRRSYQDCHMCAIRHHAEGPQFIPGSPHVTHPFRRAHISLHRECSCTLKRGDGYSRVIVKEMRSILL